MRRTEAEIERDQEIASLERREMERWKAQSRLVRAMDPVEAKVLLVRIFEILFPDPSEADPWTPDTIEEVAGVFTEGR